MTYDHWKTTNPDEQREELPMDDQPTELDLAYERIMQLEGEVDHWRKRALALQYQPSGSAAQRPVGNIQTRPSAYRGDQ